MTIEDRIAAIEAELGPAVDPGAQTIRKRIRELGEAVNGLVGRVSDVPGGSTIKQEVLAALPPSDTFALVAQIAALEKRLKAVEARPASSVQPIPSIPTPTIPLPDGSTPTVREIDFRAGSVSHKIINSENDGGWGKCFNFAIPGWRPGSSHTNPRMCQIIERDEQDGVHSWKYAKPDLVPNPNIAEELTQGEWDGLPGKSFVIKPGGQALSGRADRDVIVGTGEPGRGMTIGVVPRGGTPNELKPLMRFGEDGVFRINPDGTERPL